MLAVRGFDFEHANVRCCGRQAMHLDELKAKELTGGPEHAFAQLVELQIGLHLVHVEVVLRLAYFFGVVTVVPGFDREPRMFLVGDRLHVGDFLVDARNSGGPHLHHHLERVLRRFRHFLIERVVRVRRIAEELGAFGAQREDFRDDLLVVVRVVVVAAMVEGRPHLLAQVAPVGVGEERLHRGAGILNGPLALMTLLLGRRRRARPDRIREARQIRFSLQIQNVVRFVGQQVLTEIREECRQAAH